MRVDKALDGQGNPVTPGTMIALTMRHVGIDQQYKCVNRKHMVKLMEDAGWSWNDINDTWGYVYQCTTTPTIQYTFPWIVEKNARQFRNRDGEVVFTGYWEGKDHRGFYFVVDNLATP